MEVQKNHLLDIENFRIKLEQAIDNAKRVGYTLAQGTWSYDSLICPLSAMDPDKIRSSKDAANFYCLSEHWVESFVNGYDGYGCRNCNLEAYELGCYFRMKYNPQPYYDLLGV